MENKMSFYMFSCVVNNWSKTLQIKTNAIGHLLETHMQYQIQRAKFPLERSIILEWKKLQF